MPEVYHGDGMEEAVELEGQEGVPACPVLYRTGDLAVMKPNGELRYIGRADRQALGCAREGSWRPPHGCYIVCWLHLGPLVAPVAPFAPGPCSRSCGRDRPPWGIRSSPLGYKIVPPGV